MEIKFVLDPYKLYPHLVLIWYIYLEEDEEKFAEEIRQEVCLNMIEQYGGDKLW